MKAFHYVLFASVVYFSCLTGAGENSFAEQLSAELPDAFIIAPLGYVAVDSKFDLFDYIKGSSEDRDGTEESTWGVGINGVRLTSNDIKGFKNPSTNDVESLF